MAVHDIISTLNGDDVAEKLPSSYNIENSFMKKIIETFVEEFNEVVEAIKDIELINDIDCNFGKTLDYLGENFSERRNRDNDSSYLARIKMKNLSAGSLGDEDSIISGCAGYFGLPEALFQVKTIGIRYIEMIYPTEIDEDKLLEILKSLKAAGIKLKLTKDKFWEDYSYDQLKNLSYEDLAKLRYQREEPPSWSDYKYIEIQDMQYATLEKINYNRRENDD